MTDRLATGRRDGHEPVGICRGVSCSAPSELAPQLSVRVTSLAGLAALKLFSWSERGRETNRDAVDFWLILRNYGDPCHRERLLLEEDEMLGRGL